MRSKLVVAAMALLCFVSGGFSAARANGVFVTGHDADFHAVVSSTETPGMALRAQHIVQQAILYVTDNRPKAGLKLLLVTDRQQPGGGDTANRGPVEGMVEAGYGPGDVMALDVADDGTAGGSVLDLRGVDFKNYDAVIVASDFGGRLRQGELDILNSRSAALISYVNRGGGLVAFAESGGRSTIPFAYPDTTDDRFMFLPLVVSSELFTQFESGFTVTDFGKNLNGPGVGLVDDDVNGNFSHMIFTSYAGFDVVDRDALGNAVSIATKMPIDGEGPRIECTLATELLSTSEATRLVGR